MDYIYRFDHNHSDDPETLRRRLGGKGRFLNAATLMKDPDIQIPPGFTITTDACRKILEDERHRWPRELEAQLQSNLQDLIKENSAAARSPLLFSIRSGAPRPMLGMLHTVLNVGMNQNLLARSRQAERRFIYDCYRRFLASYGHAVLGVNEDRFRTALARKVDSPQAVHALGVEDLQALVDDYTSILAEYGGVPSDLDDQVRCAVDAVFGSWDASPAKEFRQAVPSELDIGTAVNVQVMVFGNRDDRSGTGVAYSRNPVSGRRRIAGDYLLNSQGEDVVRGSAHLRRLKELITSNEHPAIANSLECALGKLERDVFRDMCEVEFTFEDDQLWILQARPAQRTGRAALEVARSMVQDEERFITERQAIDRIEVPHLVNALHKTVNLSDAEAQSHGLAATATTIVSPGAAVGRAAFTTEDAEKMLREGQSVILITEYTMPRDAEIIRRVAGIVEFRTGFSSHSMVLARRYGKPFIAGVTGHIHLDPGATRKSFCDFETPKAPYRVATGDTVTLDATNRRLFGMRLDLDEPQRHAVVDSLLGWVRPFEPDGFEFRVNANTPDEVAKGVSEGADGVGICRTELMLDGKEEQELLVRLADRLHGDRDQECEEEIDRLQAFFADQFQQMLKNLEHRGGRAKRPLAVRLLDRFPPAEDWPVAQRYGDLSGLRGVRIGILLEPIYRLQVRAILEAARRLGNNHGRVVELIIPYVIDPSELDLMRAMVEEERGNFFRQDASRMEGLTNPIGPMIETPRAIMLSGEFARRSDFLSYGTNDLTELVFGISEREGSLAARYMGKKILQDDPTFHLDPSVRRMVHTSIRRARDQNPSIDLVVASEHAYDVESVELFLRHGFRYVSCMHHQLPVARFAVAKASIKLGRS